MKYATHLFALPKLPQPNVMWKISYYRRDEGSSAHTYFSHGIFPEKPLSEKELAALVAEKKALPLPKEIALPEGDTLCVGTNGRLWQANEKDPYSRRSQIGWYFPKKGTIEVF